MMITNHSKPTRVNRCYEGWSDQLCREAAANHGLRRTLYGRSRGRVTRERRWQSVSPSWSDTATGATTFAGQVLDEEDHPVKGALVTLGALQVSTDDGGNFLMQNPPVGSDQQFFIDGGPASTPTKSFPIVPYKVTITAGQANTLGFVPHLHFQKTTGLTDIANSAVQRIVTDPAIPGLQMTIPAGASITGWDNQPNTQISVRPVPLDRIPIPSLPGDRVGVTAYMDHFGKPGGGTPSEPIPITFPNDLGAVPSACPVGVSGSTRQ